MFLLYFFQMKVTGLAVVSVLCFTSSASVAIFTDIPVCLLLVIRLSFVLDA